MKKVMGLTIGLFIAAGQVLAVEPVTKIIPQPDSALQVISYSAEYQGKTSVLTDGIYHKAEVKNSGDTTIAAAKLAFLSFDAWNEYIDLEVGVLMDELDVNEDEEGLAIAESCAAASFFTGIVYVDKIRFVDGRVWEANPENIAAQVRRFFPSFDVQNLKHDKTAQHEVCG